jgi:hypothetical protein
MNSKFGHVTTADLSGLTTVKNGDHCTSGKK